MCLCGAPRSAPIPLGSSHLLRLPAQSREKGLRLFARVRVSAHSPFISFPTPLFPDSYFPSSGTHSFLRLEVLERLLPRTPPPPPPLMESEMLQSPLLGLGEEDEADLTDWNLPLAFMKKRHCEKIEGSKSLAQSWRMKDRVSGFRLCPLDLGRFFHEESSEPEKCPWESSGIFSQAHVASQLKSTSHFRL